MYSQFGLFGKRLRNIPHTVLAGAKAAETLRERFRKEAERKKAVREAETQERRRSEKLNQLVEKFGKNPKH